jgi:hypothetical protein
MNKRKIAYWNSLRKRLNIVVFILGTALFLLSWMLNKEIRMSNLFRVFEYFVLINFPLLILELIDRSFDLKEQKAIKKYFKIVALVGVVMIPVLYAILIFKEI